jgi:riboflavin kinase/FMN adenylyltransferase
MRRVAAESAENPRFSADDPALKSLLFNAYISISVKRLPILIVLHSAEEASSDFPLGSVLTWGNFDGMHLGHQALIRATISKAEELDLPSVVMTFNPHPAVFFRGGGAAKSIADIQDKLVLLERLGVDYALMLPFNLNIANLGPEEFLQFLPAQTLNAKAMVLGYDLAFGRNRQGNFGFLQARSSKFGYVLEQIPPVYLQGRPISSTWIRNELAGGNLDKLPALLGRQHSVHGAVRAGFRRGRVLGFATANLDPGELLLPPEGVYACLARLNREKINIAAACNLGLNPSFGGGTKSLEAHLIDFTREIYGENLRLYFIKRLRGEKAFSTPQELSVQISLDVQKTREIIAKVSADHAFPEIYPL